MGVTKLPSFYDYLGQGVEKFSENQHRKQQEDLANKYQRLNTMLSLYGQGGIDASTMQSTIQGSGIPGFQGISVQPTEVERKRAFVGALPSEQQKDAQFQQFGIDNPADVATKRQANTANARIATTNANTADELAPTVAAKTKLDFGDAQAKTYDEAGKRYIGSIVSQSGGRIDPKKAKETIDQAFTKYLADRQTSGAGVLSDPTIVRAHFENAMHDFIIEQRKLDIQAAAANNRMTPEERTAQTLIALENNTAARANQLLQGMGEAGKVFLDKPLDQVPESFRGVVKEYQDAMKYRARIRDAIANTSPEAVRKILTESGGKTTPPGQTSGVTLNPQQYGEAKNFVSQLPQGSRKQFLDERLQSGKIDKASYDKMIKELGIK